MTHNFMMSCSATSPSFIYVSNPALDSSLCRAAAPRLRPLQFISCCSPIASASIHQLLLPDCIDPLQLLLPICVSFSCCSPIASASAAAPQLRPLQLQLLPSASALTAAPRLHLPAVLEDSTHTHTHTHKHTVKI